MNKGRELSIWAKLNAIGLVVAGAGMLLQIAAGSRLYPTLTGPIVLLAAGVLVALRPDSWARFVGVVVPLVLGVGAIVAAVMTGEVIDQLTNIGSAAVAFGSWVHLIGLAAAITGGVRRLLEPRSLVIVGR